MRARKSHSLRKIVVKTPGNRITFHYSKRKPSMAHCAGCHQPLHGVPSAIPSKLNKLAKSSKRPERPYGGVLCSKCMRLTIKERIRSSESN